MALAPFASARASPAARGHLPWQVNKGGKALGAGATHVPRATMATVGLPQVTRGPAHARCHPPHLFVSGQLQGHRGAEGIAVGARAGRPLVASGLVAAAPLLPPRGASWNEPPQGSLDGLQKEFGVPSRLWGSLELPLLCSLSLGIGSRCPLVFRNPLGDESPGAQSALN